MVNKHTLSWLVNTIYLLVISAAITWYFLFFVFGLITFHTLFDIHNDRYLLLFKSCESPHMFICMDTYIYTYVVCLKCICKVFPSLWRILLVKVCTNKVVITAINQNVFCMKLYLWPAFVKDNFTNYTFFFSSQHCLFQQVNTLKNHPTSPICLIVF